MAAAALASRLASAAFALAFAALLTSPALASAHRVEPPLALFHVKKTDTGAPIVQHYTIPAGVTHVDIRAVGGAGGNGYEREAGGVAGKGGFGGVAEAVFRVEPGEVLAVRVGDGGASSDERCWNYEYSGKPKGTRMPGGSGGLHNDSKGGNGGGAGCEGILGGAICKASPCGGGGGGGGGASEVGRARIEAGKVVEGSLLIAAGGGGGGGGGGTGLLCTGGNGGNAGWPGRSPTNGGNGSAHAGGAGGGIRGESSTHRNGTDGGTTEGNAAGGGGGGAGGRPGGEGGKAGVQPTRRDYCAAYGYEKAGAGGGGAGGWSEVAHGSDVRYGLSDRPPGYQGYVKIFEFCPAPAADVVGVFAASPLRFDSLSLDPAAAAPRSQSGCPSPPPPRVTG